MRSRWLAASGIYGRRYIIHNGKGDRNIITPQQGHTHHATPVPISSTQISTTEQDTSQQQQPMVQFEKKRQILNFENANGYLFFDSARGPFDPKTINGPYKKYRVMVKRAARAE